MEQGLGFRAVLGALGLGVLRVEGQKPAHSAVREGVPILDEAWRYDLRDPTLPKASPFRV